MEETGMTVEQIIDSDFEEIDSRIAQKVGHEIKDYLIDDGLSVRGQIYAMEGRLLSMNEMDEGLARHDRRKSPFVRKTVSRV